MEQFERIDWNNKPLAYIIRAEMNPKTTTFLTPPEFNFQMGFVVYPAKGEIRRHIHRSVRRKIAGTSECLFIKKGRCEVDIYNDDQTLVITRELHSGDILLMVAGGHGFRMLEDTIFLEIKQGPYLGDDQRVQF